MDPPAAGAVDLEALREKIRKVLDAADKGLTQGHAGKGMGASIPCCPAHAQVDLAREALDDLTRAALTPPSPATAEGAQEDSCLVWSRETPKLPLAKGTYEYRWADDPVNVYTLTHWAPVWKLTGPEHNDGRIFEWRGPVLEAAPASPPPVSQETKDGDVPSPSAREPSALETALRKSRLIGRMLDKEFWDIHMVDIKFRYNGKDVWEEGDWICDLWGIVQRSKAPEGHGEAQAEPSPPHVTSTLPTQAATPDPREGAGEGRQG